MKKKILVIGRDSSAVDPTSQFSRRVSEYAKHHDFTFVVMNKGVRQERMVADTQIIVCGGKTLPTAFFNALTVGYRELKKGGYDLVTTQDVLYAGIVGLLLARRFSLPLYAQMHGDYLDNPKWWSSDVGRFNRVMNGVGVFVLKRAHFVRAVSGRLRTQLIATYGLKPQQVISIPIGTEVSLFQKNDAVLRKRSIFFAQRLLPEKGALLFAHVVTAVMQTHPDVTTDIAGDGFLKSDMEAYFKNAGVLDRVTFHGAVPQETLVSLYQQSYVYLHTADWEGWGMPMIEAMAAGTPVVTTDTGCAGEAVRHEETGLVVPINDEAGLIKETKRLLTDTELWNRLSTHSVAEAQEWSFEALSLKNMQWYGT